MPRKPMPPAPDLDLLVAEIEAEICLKRRGIGWLGCEQSVIESIRASLKLILADRLTPKR